MTTGEGELRFESELDAPPEKVWRALATPELREAWLGEPEGGPAAVVRSEPPRRLDLLWPTAEGACLVSFEVTPRGASGAHLVIVHRVPMSSVVVLRALGQGSPGWRMAA